VRLATWPAKLDPARVNPEPLITRGEIEAAFFALYDLLEEVRTIRRWLEGEDGEEVQEDLE
jgi:hypothetical protein